ncbi:MAG: hypothetical protein HND53_13845 [Proteobacteria bacterium]|nr:hypothetical protein [Pseudomonadota bacterium]NOG61580.1 hypothetical protein [Pseudomonadota bacterium]
MYNKELVYIGIDDTDNLTSRGTGSRARELIELLEENKLAKGLAVTRHQLLIDDRVPYTSHNSSACLAINVYQGISHDQLMNCCRTYLLDIAAEGSDVGLCLATEEQAKAVIEFGEKAKVELVMQDEAREVADKFNIRLEGLTGDHQGIIGSMSAVGLHVHGNDGRYLWPRDIRVYYDQTISLQAVKSQRGIDKVTLIDGIEVNDEQAEIYLGGWPRAVRINHQAVLLVEKNNEQHQYKVLEKNSIKSIRP